MTTTAYEDRKDDVRYSFAVGKIRALETRLLDAIFFKRLIEAKDAREMVGILGETPYGELLKEESANIDFENLLKAELKRTYTSISAIDPDPASACNLLALRYDFHNLKVLLKLLQSISEADSFLTPLGSFGPEVIRSMVISGDYTSFAPEIAESVSSLVAELERLSPSSQWIDIQLDRILYSYLLHEAERRKIKFLTNLFRMQIDLNNIRTLLRVKQIEKDRSFLQSVLLEGGEISEDSLLSLLEEPTDRLVSNLSYTSYAHLVKEGVEFYEKEKSLALFELLADNFIIKYMSQTIYIAFGVEPLISYILAKENETKNLRIIMVGKQNKLPTTMIEERLREIYG